MIGIYEDLKELISLLLVINSADLGYNEEIAVAAFKEHVITVENYSAGIVLCHIQIRDAKFISKLPH